MRMHRLGHTERVDEQQQPLPWIYCDKVVASILQFCFLTNKYIDPSYTILKNCKAILTTLREMF